MRNTAIELNETEKDLAVNAWLKGILESDTLSDAQKTEAQKYAQMLRKSMSK